MAGGYEVIVVGAGAGGGVVATRLAERGRSVLLLEAGPDFGEGEIPPIITTEHKTTTFGDFDWDYRSEGDREIALPRGRVVGGSTSINSIAAVRPQPADLDAWGVPGWSWEECLPALCRIEDDADYGEEPYHGRGGPVRVERTAVAAAIPVMRAGVEACLEAGYADCPDQNSPGATGAGPQPANVSRGVRQSTLVTYLRAARGLPGFTLRANALVDRVQLSGGRAVGVVLNDGEQIRCGRVVLAAGAYATPAILMRSGIGPAGHLEEHGVDVLHDLPVGDGLLDHPALPGVLGLAPDPAYVDAGLNERFMLRTSFEGRDGEEDVHIFGPFTRRSIGEPMPENGFVIAGFATRPRSRGTVRLRSADPAAAPRIVLNYFDEPEDLDVMVRCVRAIHELFAQPALAKVTEQVVFPAVGTPDDELREMIRAGSLTDHHPVGTCAIGPVVDARLRVNGVDGLFVADASVMPDIPRANTNFPTMMIGERFVELWED